MEQLDGKTALVTGATSDIGPATARRFADEGAHMFITGRRQGRLDEAVASIGPAATGNPYGASSTDPQDGSGPSEQELAAARYQGKRIAEKAAILAAARV